MGITVWVISVNISCFRPRLWANSVHVLGLAIRRRWIGNQASAAPWQSNGCGKHEQGGHGTQFDIALNMQIHVPMLLSTFSRMDHFRMLPSSETAPCSPYVIWRFGGTCRATCYKLVSWSSDFDSSETSVHIRTTRRYILEDGNIHNYRCENDRS
jgi:hypothetical protein